MGFRYTYQSLCSAQRFVNLFLKLSFPLLSQDVALGSPKTNVLQPFRFCGRLFTSNALGAASASVCSQTRPFKIEFKTDQNEVTNADTNAGTSELKEFPGGIIGFSLNYVQRPC